MQCKAAVTGGQDTSLVPEESTTPDLVELVRRQLEAANPLDLDALMSFFAPDAIWDTTTLGTSLDNATAIRGFLEEWTSAYDEWEIDGEEIRDLGNGVSLVVMVQEGRPVGSTGHVRFRFAWVQTWADGLLVHVTGYQDIDEARAAAERLAEERG
jgi:ketosteroid isomerase-like protein